MYMITWQVRLASNQSWSSLSLIMVTQSLSTLISLLTPPILLDTWFISVYSHLPYSWIHDLYQFTHTSHTPAFMIYISLLTPPILLDTWFISVYSYHPYSWIHDLYQFTHTSHTPGYMIYLTPVVSNYFILIVFKNTLTELKSLWSFFKN